MNNMNEMTSPQTSFYPEGEPRSTEFEQNIFASVNSFVEHFNMVDLKEKNTLEIMGILLYGGKFMNTSEKQLNKYRFTKYIDMTVDYYSNYLYYENLMFHYINNETVEEIKNQINKAIENKKIEDETTHYVSILNTITMFVRNKYILSKNTTLYNKDIHYMSSFVQKHNAIDSKKYIQFLMIDENIDVFSSFVSQYQNGHIFTKNDVISIYNDCKSNRIETSFVEELSKKYNIDYIKICKYIENILTNVIKTPYYYESLYKEFFVNIENKFSNIVEEFITENDNKIFNHIEEIRESIVEKGIESRDSIDNEYPILCMNAIMNNRLNINDFTTKMFYEYFMTSKSEAQLSIHLDNFTNTLSSMCDN